MTKLKTSNFEDYEMGLLLVKQVTFILSNPIPLWARQEVEDYKAKLIKTTATYLKALKEAE